LPLEWSDTKNIAWNVQLPGYGQSSPLIWQNKIFLTAIQGAKLEQLAVNELTAVVVAALRHCFTYRQEDL